MTTPSTDLARFVEAERAPIELGDAEVADLMRFLGTFSTTR